LPVFFIDLNIPASADTLENAKLVIKITNIDFSKNVFLKLIIGFLTKIKDVIY
jgi:hypothetical protein